MNMSNETYCKMVGLYKIVCVVCLVVLMVSCNSETKIACVGDSITEGAGLKVQSKTAYPFVLNRLLGPTYSVLNAGRSSATLQKKGNLPYWNCKEFANVFAFQPDVIIIKLGTNDTKPRNWNPTNYKEDYQALINTFRTISSHPEIYICLPVPVLAPVGELMIQQCFMVSSQYFTNLQKLMMYPLLIYMIR